MILNTALKRTALALAVGLTLTAFPVPQAQAQATYQYGTQPYYFITLAAESQAKCTGLSKNRLAAMMMSIPPFETGSGAAAPWPMTISRWDSGHNNLFEFSNPNTPRPRHFYNPGIGMWQLDSAGVGSRLAMHDAIITSNAAPVVAREMRDRYCNGRAWDGAWYACTNPAVNPCRSMFNTIYNASTDTLRNVTLTTAVTDTGGILRHNCRIGTGTSFVCWHIDPTKAESASGVPSWATTSTSGGRTPLTATVVTYRATLNGVLGEVREWMPGNTPYSVGAWNFRPFGTNARSNTNWHSGNLACDTTTGRGSC